jgi:NADPH-dependent glutamate synthase beta subunit-like oxidoreductase
MMAFLAVAREEGEGRNCGNQESGVTGVQDFRISGVRLPRMENRKQKTENGRRIFSAMINSGFRSRSGWQVNEHRFTAATENIVPEG